MTDKEMAIQKAKAMHRLLPELSWCQIARRLNVSDDFLRRRLDPSWAQHRRDGINASRDGRGDPAPRLNRKPALVNDTRDFTGRFMGDPIPNDPRRSK